MPMSSYEVVYRAVHFATPDRLPVSMGSLGVDDLMGWVAPAFPSERGRTGLGADEWGCVWSKTEMANMGQVTGHPLADWARFDDYPFPDADDPAAYAHVEDVLAGVGDTYVITGHFMLLFERMHALRGFQNTLEDLYLEPKLSAALADRLVDNAVRRIQRMGEIAHGRVHGFSFSDDWGTQQACFISRERWQEFFKPRYRAIFDACHAQGWDVWMHSCGYVNEIIEDLIEIGCNVMNLQQPRALGIEAIGRRYAGRIAFSSLCDIQSTLPFKSDADIREEARLLLAHWATDQGGFILSDYGDGEAIGVPLEKKRVMFDAFMAYDRWKKAS
ncbi:MAG TPA: uroporphyrinogen decarboxylase family protein [Armatimonadota bacterium]|nr:uroporphyrinogen decarboxylase family protein [Armatimonadota bacterium]HOS42444.1 uroporphyrinogen decarboxylase family protein [Armatimonadota bacterium]